MTEEIIARLRSLDLSDGGSHSRLSAIASCFLEPAYGWTRGACEELRNMLIKLLEDADGNDDNDNSDGCNCTHHRCDQHGRQVSYDVLGNERHKAVCRLRNMQMDTGNAIKKLAVALGLEWNPDNAQKSVALLQNRLIHLLGGDQPTLSDLYGIWQDGEKSENKGGESAHKMTKSAEIGKLDDDGTCPDDGPTSSITDELERQRDHWHQQATDMMNRADAMEHERDELQQTIDEMAAELDSARAKNRRLTWHIDQMQGGSKKWREQCEALTAERDELQAKLDDYDKTHAELPKDANGEQVSIGDMVHDSENGYDFRVDGFMLWGNTTEWWASQDQAVQQKLERCSIVKPLTVEQVIRDLTLGKITESQAIERIEGINGQG